MNNHQTDIMLLRITLFSLALFLFNQSAQVLLAQDPVVVAPNIQRVIFENDIMRATRAIYNPGESIGMHEHGKGLVIALTDFNVTSILPNDSSTIIIKKAGSVWWREPMKHKLVNNGKRRLEIIEIELKDTANHEATSLAREPIRVDPKHFTLEVDNDYVHVLRFRLDSLGKSPMHGHLQRFIVNLTDVQHKVTTLNGTSEKQTSKAGQFQWKSAEVHEIQNLRKKREEIISVEFKISLPSNSPNVPLKSVTLDGSEFFYIEKGKGTPVVLVHGEGSDLRMWDVQVNELAKHYRVFAYSRRYHYPNPWVGDGMDYSIQVHVKDLLAFTDKLHLGRVHLIGHGYGGTMALYAGFLYPKQIRSIITAEGIFPSLVSSAEGGQAIQQEYNVTTDSVRQTFGKGNPMQGILSFVNSNFGEHAFEMFTPQIRQMMLTNARTLGVQLRSTVRTPQPRCKDLKRLKPPPILLLEGELSPQYYHKAFDGYGQCTPGTERFVIRDASHGMMFTHADAFNKKVLEFLSTHR